jgi:hypothetical protein
MRTTLLAVALLAPLALPAAASARCVPLLTDPKGDVQETGVNPPYPVEDTRQVDLVSVDLASTRTTVTARFRLERLGTESSPMESHAYEVGFTTAGTRYYLIARHDETGDEYELQKLLTGPAAPEDQPIAPGAAESLASLEGTYDGRHHTITVTAPRSAFGDAFGRELTAVRASTYAGVRPPGGTVYEWADRGRTDRVHRVGTRGCS